jgi:photosystem II stability/assembly factor-like uncharacterized protein
MMKLSLYRIVLSAIVTLGSLLALPVNAQWTKINSPQGPASISSIAVSGNKVFVATSKSLLVSTDNGAQWKKNTGSSDTNLISVSAKDEIVFASTESGKLFISVDTGSHFSSFDSVLQSRNIQRLITFKNIFLARDDSGKTSLSFDKGHTWKETPLGKKVNAISMVGSMLVAATNSHGIYRSADSGSTWSKLDSTPDFDFLITNGTYLFGADISGIFRSVDTGRTWAKVNNTHVQNLIVCGSTIFGGTANNTLVSSPDAGTTWKTQPLIPNISENINVGNVLVAANETSIFASLKGYLFRSTNFGETWDSITTGLLEDIEILTLAGKDDTIYAGTRISGVFKSVDGGKHWSSLNNGLKSLAISEIKMINYSPYLCSDSGIFWSQLSGLNWVPMVDSGLSRNKVLSVCRGSSGLYALTENGGLYSNIFNSNHWTSVDNLDADYISGISAYNNLVFAGTTEGVFHSNDKGATWQFTKTEGVSRGIVADSQYVLAITPTGVIISYDKASTWERANLPYVMSGVYSCLATHGDTIFAGSTGGVIKSIDKGKTWSFFNENIAEEYNNYIIALVVSGNNLFASNYRGLWKRPVSEASIGVNYPLQKLTNNSVSFQVNMQNQLYDKASIQFTLPVAQQVDVAVYSLTGKKLCSLVESFLGAGLHSYTWDLPGAGAGSYLIRMRSNSGIQTKRLIKQ